MKFFLHTQSKIRIIHGDQEWSGTPDQFQQYEPEYSGLPVLSQAPAVTRYQTPEWKYVEDSLGQKHADLVDALQYCDRISEYLIAPPAIYVHPNLTKTLLCASDPQDSLPFSVSLRTGPEPDAAIIPMSATWPITLRQKNGLAMDNILVNFVNGAFSGAYTYNENLPLGEWYVDEQDFALVDVGEITYQVRLAAPARFTIYRNL